MNNTFNQAVENAVKNAKGCQFISMRYVSEPKLNKGQKLAVSVLSGASDILPIEKVAFGQFQINYSYENAIINRGAKYLRFYGVQNGKVETTYYVGGKLASEEQVKLIKEFTERGQVKSQAEAGLTENQVIARCVKLDNIKEITISGVTYTRK